MTETKKLTKAAQRDLDALRRGEDVPDLRYGPYSQLLDAGYITGPQGAPRLVEKHTTHLAHYPHMGTWQVYCDQCGDVGVPQRLEADACAIADRHAEIGGFG